MIFIKGENIRAYIKWLYSDKKTLLGINISPNLEPNEYGVVLKKLNNYF